MHLVPLHGTTCFLRQIPCSNRGSFISQHKSFSAVRLNSDIVIHSFNKYLHPNGLIAFLVGPLSFTCPWALADVFLYILWVGNICWRSSSFLLLWRTDGDTFSVEWTAKQTNRSSIGARLERCRRFSSPLAFPARNCVGS